MSKSTALATELQSLTFDVAATAPAWMANANLYAALHTADPGAAGTQATSECAYTGYARVAIPRNAGGWLQVAGVVSNVVPIVFPPCTGGTTEAAWLTIGTASTGDGQVLHRGPLDPSIPIISGITPGVAAGGLVITIKTITEE